MPVVAAYRPLILLLVALPMLLSTLVAQERFKSVEYQTGHAGFRKKEWGRLLIGDTAIVFTTPNDKERARFLIPLRTITSVSSSSERNDASVGSKIMFGFLSRSRKNEYLQITTETPETAEGIVFKVKNSESLGIATKIRHRLKRLSGLESTSRGAGAAAEGHDLPPQQGAHLPQATATGGPWLGQPHGKIYYSSNCQAARELPEPIYFQTESEAQQLGYQHSQVPDC